MKTLNLDSLSLIERNVLITAARTEQNFEETARILNLAGVEEARNIFDQARKKLVTIYYGKLDDSWVRAKEIVQELGANRNWVESHLRPYRNQRIHGIQDGRSGIFYPPIVMEVLREKYEERTTCPDSGTYLNVSQLRERLKKSHVWLAKTLKEIGFVAERRLDSSGKITKHYPPEVLPVLIEIIAETPPSGCWLTIRDLAKRLGVDREWVTRRIKQYSFAGEVRVKPGYGRPNLHYPPSVLRVLRNLLRQTPPANGWLTISALSRKTGKSDGWISRELHLMSIKAQLRRDKQGVVRPHYPPETRQMLLHRQEQLIYRCTKGLQFRLSILRTLFGFSRAVTIPRIKMACECNDKEKKVYDSLLWLKQHGLVEVTSSHRGHKRLRWKITETGKRLVREIETT